MGSAQIETIILRGGRLFLCHVVTVGIQLAPLRGNFLYMDSILAFLFPYQPLPRNYACALLMIRLLFGGLFLWHGMMKIVTYGGDIASFPDPIGLGSRLSFYLAVFAEVICSAAVIFGAFYRLALVPMIITMAVAFFFVHHGDAFAVKELALIFMSMFVLMFCMGAGEYSLDNIIAKRLYENRLAIVDKTSAFRPEDYSKSEE